MRSWKTSFLVAMSAGVSVGSFFMNMAWRHNPQDVYHDESGVQWGNWLTLGGSWLVTVTATILGLTSVFGWISQRLRQSDEDESRSRG
jgi:hypothetical protein